MAPSTTKEQPRVTGVDIALVYTTETQGSKKVRASRFVRRGERLPSNVADGEVQRLKEAGVFDDKTHAQKVRDRRELVKRARNGDLDALVAMAPVESRTALADRLIAEQDAPDTPQVPQNTPATPWMEAPPGGTLPPTHPEATDSMIDAGTAGSLGRVKPPEDDTFDGPDFADVEDTDLSKLNRDQAVEFIGGRPGSETAHWIEEERQGKNRSTVLQAFGYQPE